MQDHLSENEKEPEPAFIPFIQPALYACFNQHPVDDNVAAYPEKIDSYTKQYRVQQPWHQNPFPKLVFYDKTVCLSIALKCGDDLF